MLVADGKVLDPREALNDMGNSSKEGVGIVLVTRDAHETNGTLLFTDDDAKVLLPLGKPSINIGNPFWLMELRDSEPSSGRLYSLTALQRMKVQICRRRMLGGSTNQKPRKRPGRSDDRKGGLAMFRPQLEQLSLVTGVLKGRPHSDTTYDFFNWEPDS